MKPLARLAAIVGIGFGAIGLSAAQAQVVVPPQQPPLRGTRPAQTQTRPQQKTSSTQRGIPVYPQNRTAYRPTQYNSYPGSMYGTPGYQNHPGYNSVLRHSPPVTDDYNYGFRNPGGVGRMSEYYPPGNQFQSGGHDPTVRAGFDQGIPVGSLQEQAMAINTGTMRYQALQNHLDNFSRPMGMWGAWGAGFAPF